jgi:hypothetical protein
MSHYQSSANTNPRYKNFCQDFYTAGDEEQFQSARDKSPSESDEVKVFITSRTATATATTDDETAADAAANQESILGEKIFHKYTNLSGEYVTTTFRYIFNKFKKGIFIRIKDNKLVTFLPFSKAKFFNEWSERIKIDPSTTLIDFMKHINEMEQRPFNEKRINRFISGWYANNCLLRYESPINEGDTGTHHIKAMFEELCDSRDVPDVELFINRRDFPILKRDGTEPYNHIFDSENVPLLSHDYDKYIPILSAVTGDSFADLPIPTLDDWARVKYFEGVTYPKTDRRVFINSPADLESDPESRSRTVSTSSSISSEMLSTAKANDSFHARKSVAVFRGSSTGAGVSIETNPRLKVAFMSSLSPLDERDQQPLLDAGITDWNLRPRKIQGEEYLKTIEINTLPFGLVPKLTLEQQMSYKYIIHIDGHVSAFRLSQELAMGCVLLIVDSPYRLWFRDWLKPFVHYVPVQADLSDLLDKIKWCKAHEEECILMTENCKEFYNSNLQKDGILNYLQRLLAELSPEFRYSYTKASPSELQMTIERDWLSKNGMKMHLFDKEVTLAKTQKSTIREMVLNFENAKQSTLVIVKQTEDRLKIVENLHEAYIGVNEINSALVDLMPNFARTYGFIPETNAVVSEKINGITLLDWLNSSKFNFTDFIDILGQVSLALEVAQQEIGFVHYDLFPWNILIQRSDLPQVICYPTAYNKVIQIQTSLIPIMIDFGKSHILKSHFGRDADVTLIFGAYQPSSQTHCGIINMFSFSTVQDILSLTLSALSIILKKDERFPAAMLIKLAKFFSCKEIKSVFDLKTFVYNNSTFSNLVTRCRDETDKKTPMDFVNYLSSQFNFRFTQVQSSFYRQPASHSNLRVNESYLKNTHETAYIYYIFQKSVAGCRQSMMEKLSDDSVGFKFKLDSIFKKIFSFIHSVQLHSEFFLNKNKCKKTLKVFKQIFNQAKSCLNYLDILHSILLYKGEYELLSKDRSFLLKNYGCILKHRRDLHCFVANCETVFLYDSLIYA